jgi:hypothetical protein
MRSSAAVLVMVLLFPPFALAQTQLGDQVSLGRSIIVDKDQTSEDVVCIGCSATVHGFVKGDIVTVGGSINIDGRVKGDLVTVGGNARLGAGAEVGGDVAVIGGHLQRDPTAVVRGSVETPLGGHGLGLLLGGWFLGSLLGLVPLSIVLALLCYALAGNARVQNVAATLAAKTGWSALVGIGVLVAAVALTAMFEHIKGVAGILIFFVWIAVCLAAVLGWTGLSAWIGHRIGATAAPLSAIVVGAIIVAVLESIPVAGAFILLVFLLLALGSAVVSGYGATPMWMENWLGPRPPAPPPPKAAAGP